MNCRPPAQPLLYGRALRGVEPADALTTADRQRLIIELHGWGWTDVEVAAHTRLTTYTAARIRADLGLLPNRPSRSEGAA